MDLNKVKPEQVLSAYRGRAGSCRCGCKGTYRYTKVNQEAAGKNRGYEVGDDEVSDRSVKQTLAMLQTQHMCFPVDVERSVIRDGETIFDMQVGNRDYTVYVKEQDAA